jgi:hypothetical protein
MESLDGMPRCAVRSAVEALTKGEATTGVPLEKGSISS